MTSIAEEAAQKGWLHWEPGKLPPLEPRPSKPFVPLSGANKYHGPVAAGYDAKREESPKWIAEQAIIESMLDGLPTGAWILDCPVGSGRFIRAYEERKFCVWAVDLSEDMLREALKKRTVKDNRIQFGLGDVRQLDGMWDKSVDCSIMCRLTRWLSPEDCTKAIHELARVTRKLIIFTTRIRHERVPEIARPLELFTVEGWKIARDEAADGPDYRVVAMEPV